MGGLIFLAIVCCIPLWLRIINSVWVPLVVEAGGATFTGHYRRWQINAVTGRVEGTNTYTTTRTDPTYGTVRTEGGGTASVVTGIKTTTKVHNTLLLVDRTGQQRSFTLTDFRLEVFKNQIVSVCWAVRGRKSVTFAVLNHSARRQFFNNHNLQRILYPHGLMLGFWLTGWALIALVAGVAFSFGGFLVFMAIFVISVILTFLATQRQIRRFGRSGVTPLWQSTAAVVAAP